MSAHKPTGHRFEANQFSGWLLGRDIPPELPPAPAPEPICGFMAEMPAPIAKRKPRSKRSRLIIDDGDSHALFCVPTGGGKGRNLLIPQLLTYDGPVMCVDIKGECFSIAARRRKEMGHVWRQLPWPVDDNYLGRLRT